ncbi:dehydrogenase [Corticibacter populi]|uniref:Dehydrogenase n=1 Tax=Corticibacter populi TaxID=1550736 RepID=A0A3M6QMA4_9BURK|nr:nucleotidyltransferase family protein [Corticibacter populi]RMX04174.1 dehydrogenase [Corticibacter populi]RZS33196.1 D-glycero-alpha-D-manno-heptose 1-phosphate guanylyltransferase [Corticibacter populi]
MEAIILAGGLGTRLRAVVPDTPKPMAPVAGRPFLEILLTLLANKGFHRVILSVGYKAEAIRSHFGTRFEDMDLVYEMEPQPLGTGGALRQAITQISGDHVFVFNGDTYLDLEVSDVEALWQEFGQPIIVARKVDDVARYGQVALAGRRVLSFGEKSGSGPGLINAGCYVLPVHVFANVLLPAPFSLEQSVLEPLVASGAVMAHVTQGLFIDIGIPEDYERAQTLLRVASQRAC